PFDISSGKTLKKSLPSYTAVFSRALLRQAEKNKKIVAITAAMPEGTGLEAFSKKFPDRFFDVGIAEQHAVTMAAGLAVHGMKPVVAIYSTFLQRAFDQLVHDIALQKLPVVFAIDRAGVVGEDGETHQGLLDLSYLGQIPGFVVMAPKDGTELEAMLEFALSLDEPVAIRYPKGDIPASLPLPAEPVKKGKAELLREGDDLLILALGSTVSPSYYAAEQLALQGLHCTVINARFMQPLDEELILKWAKKCGRVLTIEEHQIVGGFGHAFLGMLERRCIYNIEVKRMGLATPFIEHGPRNIILQENGLDQNGIYKSAYNFILQGRQL
ncbi:MAG: 1-deoxy-D-xylulose-5-phosphate synthase, partial [Firmicutes bacterium]|nr:1-deoxy-D-xylulose-5-phosphate synthase [Bacillota bacterium]